MSIPPDSERSDAGARLAPRKANGGLDWQSILRSAALVVAVLMLIWIGFNVRLPELSVLRARIESYGVWSSLVFVAVYAVVALTPIPVTIMALTGGVLFGIVEGSFLSVIGSMIGAYGAYWIARLLGRSTVLRMLGSHRDTLEERLEHGSFSAVFTLRVLPGIPYWPVNYAAGGLGVGQRDFLVASLIASVPGQVSLVGIGAFAAQPTVALGVAVVLAWLIVGFFSVWAWRSWRGIARHPLPGAPTDEAPAA
ncbi:TVP38/TMEM64 family protein [Nigerium massiliense]|uniref:TVP38/TMEM64 family protein n=1 Tax=Nigerium massiliense TaxID=1522317 RepID=UPI000907D59D|nr:TVP38/TMEM64 family protein [Nigerium massiliense]